MDQVAREEMIRDIKQTFDQYQAALICTAAAREEVDPIIDSLIEKLTPEAQKIVREQRESTIRMIMWRYADLVFPLDMQDWNSVVVDIYEKWMYLGVRLCFPFEETNEKRGERVIKFNRDEEITSPPEIDNARKYYQATIRVLGEAEKKARILVEKIVEVLPDWVKDIFQSQKEEIVKLITIGKGSFVLPDGIEARREEHTRPIMNALSHQFGFTEILMGDDSKLHLTVFGYRVATP